MIIPTNLDEIKEALRSIGEPVTLFGEGPVERSNRLKQKMAILNIGDFNIAAKPDKNEDNVNEEYYYRASEELVIARKRIAYFSFDRAKKRLKPQRDLQSDLDMYQKYLNDLNELNDKMKQFEITGSHNGGPRSLSCIKFSPKSDYIATGCWNGEVSLWDSQDGNNVRIYGQHNSQVFSVDFHPGCGISQNPKVCNLASGDCTGCIKLWNMENNECISTMEGHLQRIGRLQFHPCGLYLGSVSYDETFRLWDIETSEGLLIQEGHHKPIHALSFQVDGSLAITGDNVGVGLVWDIRSGKCVHHLIGHLGEIVNCDCSPNGYFIATCSSDNTSKIWDLRKKECLYTLPGHVDLISDIKFSKTNGEFLVTSSFDKTIKVWSIRNFSCLSTLKGHEGKITSIDFNQSDDIIISCGLDRTWKKWEIIKY